MGLREEELEKLKEYLLSEMKRCDDVAEIKAELEDGLEESIYMTGKSFAYWDSYKRLKEIINNF